MDLVLLKCAKCRAKVGSLPNLWTQIGRKYITQAGIAQDGDGDGRGRAGALGVEAAGAVRLGDADTLIAGCELREAACEKCHASLGQICIKSPPNHELHDGQIIFRVSSLTLKSDADHRRVAQLNIRNVLKLRDPSAAAPLAQEDSPSKLGMTSTSVEKAGGGVPNPNANASLDLARVQNDLEAQKREIQRIGATGFQVVSSFETSVARFEQQMKRMSLSIESVRDDQQAGRKDLSALKARVTELQRQPPPPPPPATPAATSPPHQQPSSADVARLEAQMQAAEKSVGELRQGYQRARSEAAGLRDELRQAQQQLQQVRDDNAALRADAREAHELAKEGIDTSRLYAAEVASLRREVQQLRADLASGALQAPPPALPPPAQHPDDGYGYDSSSFFQTHSHELDILASNISKIGHRASQIESLQMEFQLFRTRVQRLEAKSGSCTPARSEYGSAMSAGEQQGATTSLQRYQQHHSGGVRVGSSTHRKRPSMSGDDPLSLDPTPSKRVAIASSQTVGLSSDRAGAGEEGGQGDDDDDQERQQPSSPPALRAPTLVQRLAKGAPVDRARTRRVSGRAKR